MNDTTRVSAVVTRGEFIDNTSSLSMSSKGESDGDREYTIDGTDGEESRRRQ